MEKKNIDWGNIGFGYIKTDEKDMFQPTRMANGMRADLLRTA